MGTHPYFFLSCSIKASVITFSLSQVGCRVWNTESDKLLCQAIPTPSKRKSQLKVGWKGISSFFMIIHDFSFKQKHPSLPLNKKKQYWALGADSSTRSGFGEDCFFSVIRMISVIRLVQEVKLWPLRWKTNFNAKPFPLFHSRDQKKKKSFTRLLRYLLLVCRMHAMTDSTNSND